MESDSLTRIKYLFYKDVIFPRPDKNGKIVKKKYIDLTVEEREKMPPPYPVPSGKQPTQAQLDEWLDAKKFGVWLDEKRVSSEVLKKYKPADFGDYFISRLEKNAINYGKHYFQVDVYTQKHFEANRQSYIKKLELDK